MSPNTESQATDKYLHLYPSNPTTDTTQCSDLPHFSSFLPFSQLLVSHYNPLLHSTSPNLPPVAVTAYNDPSGIPWPSNYPLCQGNPTVTFCDRGNNPGIRWSSDGCIFWTSGFCFTGPLPGRVVSEFAWPPVGPLAGNPSIQYKDITEDLLNQWLQLRNVRVDRRVVVGKDALFQLAAADVTKVACKVGVQGSPGFS